MSWPFLKTFAKALLLIVIALVFCAPVTGTTHIAFADTLAGSGPGGTDGSSTLSQAEATTLRSDVQYELTHHPERFTQADADWHNNEINQGLQGKLNANDLRILRDWGITVEQEKVAEAAAQSASSSAQVAANAAAAAAAAGKCDSGIGGIGCWISHLPNMIVSWLGFVILMFSGWLLALCGVLFNWTVLRTVFQFATYFGNSAGMLIAWGVLRDVGNILLLFGFIFLGVTTILNVNVHGHSASSSIPRLIIFALLLNFSLLAAEAVIDTSNAFASVLASQAGVSCTGTVTSTGSSNCANQGISGKALALVGLGSAWQTPNELGDAANQSILTTITTYMGGSIFIIILAFVLLAAAIMLVSRAVLLCFLIVTSPIGFAGMAIPPLEGLAKKWWKMLLSESFFAPVLILCILVSLKIADSMSNGASLIGALQGGSADAMQVALVFAVIIGFLLASLIAAKQMGAAGASFATDFSKKAVSKALYYSPPAMAGRLAGAGAARLGGVGLRAVVGGGAEHFQKGYELNMNKWRNSAFGKSGVGKMVLNATDDAAADQFAKARGAKFGLSRGHDEEKKHREERAGHLAHTAHKAHLDSELDRAVNMDESTTALMEVKDEEIQKILQQMNQQDIENSKYVKQGAIGIAALARNLSPDKFDKMMNNKDLGQDRKDNLLRTRFEKLDGDGAGGRAKGAVKKYTELTNLKNTRPLTAAEEKDRNDARDEVRKWTNEDLSLYAKYKPDEFKDLANSVDDPTTGGSGDMLISTDQYDGLKKNKVLSNSQRSNLTNHTKIGQVMAALDLPVGAAKYNTLKNLAKGMKKELGNIPDVRALVDPAMVETYDVSSLASIMSKKDDLDAASKKSIMDQIEATGPGNPQYDAVKMYLSKNGSAAGWWGRQF